MQTELFVASLGLILIGLVTTGLIYFIGARRMANSSDRRNALRWTGAFALSICTFLGVAPFLPSNPAMFILLLPFLGVALSLDSIQAIQRGAAVSAGEQPCAESAMGVET